MAKIYLCKNIGNGQLESFIGKNGRNLSKLWTVERTLKSRSGIHASFARINNKDIVIDGTAPNFLDEIPKDAIEVPNGVSELLLYAKTHYFGNLRLSENEMETFLKSEGIQILDSENLVDSTIVFDEASNYGFISEEQSNGTYIFKY